MKSLFSRLQGKFMKMGKKDKVMWMGSRTFLGKIFVFYVRAEVFNSFTQMHYLKFYIFV